MHRLPLLLAALALGTSNIAPAPDTRGGPRPARIVSLNLCADQLLLALADPGQIAALTRLARDPVMSAEAEKAKQVPLFRASAEEVMVIDPDLIIGIPAHRSAMIQALAGRKYRTLDLSTAESLADIVAQLRAVAAAVGHPERGEATVARMEADLVALPRPGGGKVAAFYQRRGYVTGTGTLVDELMTRAGLVNLAAKLGKPALAQLSLEEMVAAQPDYIIVESANARVVDQGTEMLHHPVLRDIPRLYLPQAWTVCGGPAYALAARSLAEQLARHR